MHTKIRLSLIEQGRAAEWLTSSVLLSFAVFLAFPGDTLSSTNGYVGFRNLSFDEASLATPLALISASRMAALYINGATGAVRQLFERSALWSAPWFSFFSPSPSLGRGSRRAGFSKTR